jgi:hypothetical protein
MISGLRAENWDALCQEELELLRKLWDRGKTSGDAMQIDFEAARSVARKRLKAGLD